MMFCFKYDPLFSSIWSLILSEFLQYYLEIQMSFFFLWVVGALPFLLRTGLLNTHAPSIDPRTELIQSMENPLQRSSHLASGEHREPEKVTECQISSDLANVDVVTRRRMIIKQGKVPNIQLF